MENDSLLEEYSAYSKQCNAAMKLTLVRIENLQELQNGSTGIPVSLIKSRIKTMESVKDKCRRKAYECNIENIREKIRDVAGIRIVTTFKSDIYEVARMIKKIPGVNITRTKDYVKYPKESGYRSLHLEIQVEIYDPVEGSELVPVEIQIRDKFMDCWSSVEHKINYKKENPDPTITKMLKEVADVIAKSDDMAEELKNQNLAN